MRVLLDTCTFLWLAIGSPRLSDQARATAEDPENELLLSAISSWEIAIKHGLGDLPLPDPPESYVSRIRLGLHIDSLPLDEPCALHVHRLPPLHRDPFDRMLVSQALIHGLSILTPDVLVRQYPARTIW